MTSREKRREIILATAEGRSVGRRRGNQTFHGVPPRNPDFTGRENLLTTLHEMLKVDEKPTAITQAAIHGLGGVGKTSLATEFAHQNANDYAGVWWAPAENRTDLMTSLAELARVLDARFAGEVSTERAARGALATLANQERPWLLIYDNVSAPDEIRDFRPTKGARLLITTRHPDWGGQASELEIDVLAPNEAVDFLIKRANRSDLTGAQLLAETLGHLPLALDHAGAYVTSAGISFEEYSRRYQELIARAPKGSLSTAATFDLAIERANESCPAAEGLLGFFSVLAPERIPLDVVDHSIISERDRDLAMMALFSVSLIKRDATLNHGLAVSVHRLVRTSMRARLGATKKTALTLTTATARLLALFPKDSLDDPKVWPRCEQLLPHALALGRDPESRSKFGVSLLQASGAFLCERGAYVQGEQVLREAMAMAETLLGKRHPGLAGVMQSLAAVLTYRGKTTEAESLCRAAIDILTRKRAKEDENFAMFLDTLAGILSASGRPSEAEPFRLRALSIVRTKASKKTNLTRILANLATTLSYLDKFSEAERVLREAISINEKVGGRDSYLVARQMSNLGRLLYYAGRHADAERTIVEVIASKESLYGRRHPTLANSLATQALICRDANRPAEAETLFKEAIDILSETSGGDHADMGFIRAAYGILMAANGRDYDAKEQALQAFAIHAENVRVGSRWNKPEATELAKVLDMLGLAAEAGEIRSQYRLG